MLMSLFIAFLYLQIGAGICFYFKKEHDYSGVVSFIALLCWPFVLSVVFCILVNEKKVTHVRTSNRPHPL